MLSEMEILRGGGGGCCCAARAFSQAQDPGPSSEVQKILLRFRPIAPRPAPPPPPGLGGSTKPSQEGLGGVERNRRKRIRISAVDEEADPSRRTRSARTRRGLKPKNKPRSSTNEAVAAASSTVTTSATSSEGEVAFVGTEMLGGPAAAPLFLPEVPAAPTKELPPKFPTTTELMRLPAGCWERPQVPAAGPMGHVVAPTLHMPVCSVVTVVVSSAGEWEVSADDEQQGSTGWLAGCVEGEAKRRLSTDARPALASDPSGKVLWANAAYKRMVGALDDDDDYVKATAVDGAEGVRTLLVVPSAVLEKGKTAFSCRVKVRWCGAGRTGRPLKGSITAPCDVWRLAGGNLVWRIDVRAALSLAPMGP